MTARSLREEYDDFNTLVMPTRPLLQASSMVIPISRGRDGRTGACAGVEPSHQIRTDLEPVRAGAVGTERKLAGETTQASRRHTAEVKRYRHLSIVLAIGLAFVLGVAGSLAVQMAGHFTPTAARTPRDGITRGESMQLFDGVEVKVAAAPRPHRAVASRSRSPAPAPSASTPTTTDAPDDRAPDRAPDLAGRDLLGEGLSSE